MTKISILGCGWLGLPLAKKLIKNNFEISGSTTSNEKLTVLKQEGITPYLISIQNDGISGQMTNFLKGSNTLIINIPPKLRGDSTENFVKKIELLVPHLTNSSLQNVLFISSTSVYGDSNDVITEESPLNPDSEGGRQLVLVESLLQKNTDFKTTILRFGGLIGDDRNPVKFLAGRENLDNPEAPINLIHQEDCIGVILKIIEMNAWGQTFNAVAPHHPSRAHYYSQKAIDLNLTAPTFDYQKPSIGKTIASQKIEQDLQYTFTQISL
jgi:nucleoside-diphosphate-sugar epimerase